jgi:hypothetical protein
MPRHDLVTGWNHDQTVQLMSLGHDLDGVLDQLATGKRVPHAGMAHGDSIANAYGLKLERHASGRAYAIFHSLPDPVKVNVSGNKLIERINYADEGTTDLFIRKARGLEKSPVGRPLSACFGDIAPHPKTSVETLPLCT